MSCTAPISLEGFVITGARVNTSQPVTRAFRATFALRAGKFKRLTVMENYIHSFDIEDQERGCPYVLVRDLSR